MANNLQNNFRQNQLNNNIRTSNQIQNEHSQNHYREAGMDQLLRENGKIR